MGVYETRSKGRRPSLVYCGDDKGSKAVAAELIRDVGFDPLDVGPLRIARYTEPFAQLVAELAYTGEDGPELAYRFEWFGEIGGPNKKTDWKCNCFKEPRNVLIPRSGNVSKPRVASEASCPGTSRISDFNPVRVATVHAALR